MFRGKRRWAWVAVAVMGFLIGVGLLAVLMPGGSSTPYPDPNGYDNIAAATRMLPSKQNPFDSPDRETREKALQDSSAALRELRTGLSRESRVRLPTDAVVDFARSDMMGRLVPLARLLALEGQLAESDHRLEAAAGSYLDLMRFGQSAGAGGAILDGLMAVEVESMGVDALDKLAPRLDLATASMALRRVIEMDAGNVLVAEDLIKSERDHLRSLSQGLGQAAVEIGFVLGRKRLRTIYSKTEARMKSAAQGRRRLMIRLAERAFELTHGRRPNRAEELAPDFLGEIPVDPETGQTMRL